MIERAKVIDVSASLGREYHCDKFVVGAKSSFGILFFGGSGVTPEEYSRRRATITPALDPALASFVGTNLSFELLFVTAPADGIFGRLDDEACRAAWGRHVAEELRPHLKPGPVYLMAHSGGARLALTAAADLLDCVGAGMLGADGIGEALRGPGFEGGRWCEPVALYYNTEDRVYEQNQAAIEELVATDAAICLRQKRGGHALVDYVRNESVAGLVRRAAKAAMQGR